MAGAELRLGPCIQHYRALTLQFQNRKRIEHRERRQFSQRRRSGSVDFGIAQKITGTLRKRIGQQVDEFFAASGFERVVVGALLGDSRAALRTDLASA